MRLDIENNPTTPAALTNVSQEEFDSYRNSARLLKRGIFAAQSGDRDAARKLLTQVVALDPASEDAWMWLASISDYPEELMAFLDRVLAINPANERAIEWHAATATLMAKTFVKRAITAHHDGDTKFADECIEQALAHDVKCVDAWLWRASIVTDEGERMECLQRVLEIDPENADAHDAIDQITARREEERRLEEERLAEEARLAAEEERLAEERRVAALFNDAKSAALAGDNAKALVLIHAYLESHADNAEAWVFCSHLSQTVEEKLSSLQKALAIDPNNAAAKSGYDFLTSMAAPKIDPQPEVSDEPNTDNMSAAKVSQEADHADDGHQSTEQLLGPINDEMSGAEAVTEEPALSADEYPEVDAEFAEPMFAPVVAVEVGQNGNGHDPYDTVELSTDPGDASEGRDSTTLELSAEDSAAPPFDEVADAAAANACPFCHHEHAPNAFECEQCRAILSLSDLEMVLANSTVDRNAVSRAVVRMEADWNEREFSVSELTTLALGHLNLGSFDAGRKYLQEALHLDSNNVVLASQLNALSIRLDEIARQREADESRPRGKTILVVDDSATVRKLISGKLEKSGHNVINARDGVEALERLSEEIPDLVLLDITMPRMDGYEVCKQIRANPDCSHVPVVMISGKDGFFDKVRGRMAGATGYVTKPFGPETLMRALETYLLPDAPSPEFQAEPELEAVV